MSSEVGLITLKKVISKEVPKLNKKHPKKLWKGYNCLFTKELQKIRPSAAF